MRSIIVCAVLVCFLAPSCKKEKLSEVIAASTNNPSLLTSTTWRISSSKYMTTYTNKMEPTLVVDFFTDGKMAISNPADQTSSADIWSFKDNLITFNEIGYNAANRSWKVDRLTNDELWISQTCRVSGVTITNEIRFRKN